jgi:hypothetical protein
MQRNRHQRNRHSTQFKEQALSQARTRGTRTLESIATEVPARQWTPAQRLLALNESHALSGPALHAWCREKGLFEHHSRQWREAFCDCAATPAASVGEQRAAQTALRELQGRHDQLQREMRRKDRALAEAAALLVLQKRFSMAWVLQQSEGEDK